MTTISPSPVAPSEPTSRTVVAVIGLGYVGLPLARAMWSAGHSVIGLDADPRKIEILKEGRCYLKHLGASFITDMTASGRFSPTTDAMQLALADAVIICVPTPLDQGGQPDLTYITQTAQVIAKALSTRDHEQLVVLESTTYPGTTREVVKPLLDATGVPFLLAFSPERENPGMEEFKTTDIPKLVGGIDEASTRAAVALYASAFKRVVEVSSAEVAESAKLLENIYRAVNIALVNEMKVVLEAMNIDVWEVVSAAATKPFGFQAFYPGPGLGGHCIPIDPFYMSWRARQVGVEAKFIELAGEINESMPHRVIARTLQTIARTSEKSISSLRILILGLSYKPDIDDVRESPSFALIEGFRHAGCGTVHYSDPHIPETHSMRRWGNLDLRSVWPLTPEAIRSYDALVLSTAHKAFDYAMIAQHARLIVDTRNAFAKVSVDGSQARIIKA